MEIVPNMTPNKQFNTYKEGLDLKFLRAYCMEHGGARREAGGDWRAGTVGGLREAGLLQIHGSQQRGEQGLLH